MATRKVTRRPRSRRERRALVVPLVGPSATPHVVRRGDLVLWFNETRRDLYVHFCFKWPFAGRRTAIAVRAGQPSKAMVVLPDADGPFYYRICKLPSRTRCCKGFDPQHVPMGDPVIDVTDRTDWE